MFKLKDERQSLTGVIADSFRLLNKTWAINIIVVLIGIVISLIILFLFSWGIIADVMHQVMRLKGHHGAMSPTDLPFLKPVFSGPMILFYCGLFIAAWISKITVAILVRTSWNIATKNEAKLKNAFAVGLKYFYVYFCLLLILLAVYVAVYFVQWLFSLIHLYWLDVIIAILTQLVIYYVAIKLFLVEASAVIDECGIRGIGRSWRVVQGSWWRTVGSLFFSTYFYLVVIFLVGIGIFFAVFAPGFSPILSNVSLNKTPTWFMVLFSIAGIVSLLCFIFTMPSMFAANQTVLYKDLKCRKGEKTGPKQD